MDQVDKPDWDFWTGATLVNLQCAVALSMDIEPVLDNDVRKTHKDGYVYVEKTIPAKTKVTRSNPFERRELFHNENVSLAYTVPEKKILDKRLAITSTQIVDNQEYKSRLQEVAMWVKSGKLSRTDSREIKHLKHAYNKIVLLKDFVKLVIENNLSVPKELAKVLDINESSGTLVKRSRTADRNKRLMKRRAELIAAGHGSVAKQLHKEFDSEFNNTKTIQNIICNENKKTK